MRKYRLATITVLTLFLLSSFCSIAFSEADKTSIQYVANGIKSIQKYQVNLNTKILIDFLSD